MNSLDMRAIFVAGFLALAVAPVSALTAEDINSVSFKNRNTHSTRGPDPFVVKAQALLSRRSVSPGVIDGIDGENFRKAVAQLRRQEQLGEGNEIDELTWLKLGGETTNDIVTSYEITAKDAQYDFADEIPRDYAKQAEMKRLSYTSPEEMLGEHFHMSETFLGLLNPSADYSKAGSKIQVMSVTRVLQPGSAQRIDAVKSTGMVLVFGANDAVLASYPATIGSDNTPSPSGSYTVERVARNPNYTYDPEKNFQQGKNDEKLTLPPGPNGPVGTVWIALSKPTFGIHGTPEPAKISKTSSHGCVRLTNWDAEELATLVKPGVSVRFVD